MGLILINDVFLSRSPSATPLPSIPGRRSGPEGAHRYPKAGAGPVAP